MSYSSWKSIIPLQANGSFVEKTFLIGTLRRALEGEASILKSKLLGEGERHGPEQDTKGQGQGVPERQRQTISKIVESLGLSMGMADSETQQRDVKKISV